MKTVKFLMPHTVGALYNTDEIAGFSDEIADDLIERKIAALHKGKGATAPAATLSADDLKDMSDVDLDKLIKAKKVDVADDAAREAKVSAVVAANIKK